MGSIAVRYENAPQAICPPKVIALRNMYNRWHDARCLYRGASAQQNTSYLRDKEGEQTDLIPLQTSHLEFLSVRTRVCLPWSTCSVFQILIDIAETLYRLRTVTMDQPAPPNGLSAVDFHREGQIRGACPYCKKTDCGGGCRKYVKYLANI